MVRIPCPLRPLSSWGTPVALSTGGKSGFRRINTQLQSCLESRASELAQQVANLLLAIDNDTSMRRVIDCLSNLRHHPFKIAAHPFD